MDVQIGKNLAEARGEMTQQALGAAMRERGFKWSQATVWSVEKGDRQLRLSEALALTRILRVPLWSLAHGGFEGVLAEALKRVESTGETWAEVTLEYFDALRELEDAAQSPRPLDDPSLFGRTAVEADPREPARKLSRASRAAILKGEHNRDVAAVVLERAGFALGKEIPEESEGHRQEVLDRALDAFGWGHIDATAPAITVGVPTAHMTGTTTTGDETTDDEIDRRKGDRGERQ